MSTEQEKGIIVFFSYATRDKILRDRLEEHLSNLKYRGLITTWHDREVLAGTNWLQQIDAVLQNSQIILLLISATFMASDYCYGTEMQQALQLHEQQKAVVIPVLLRPVLFTNAPFSRLSMLPRNGKPVTKWRDRDSAFVDVALNIERVAEHYSHNRLSKSSPLAPPPSFERVDPGTTYRNYVDEYRCPACGTDTRPGATFCLNCGNRLRHIGSIQPSSVCTVENGVSPSDEDETLQPEAPGSDPLIAAAIPGFQSRDFEATRRSYYAESVVAYERALSKNPGDGAALLGLGKALYGLEKYNEALSAFQRAIQLQATSVAYAGVGDVHTSLEHYGSALAAYDKALRLNAGVALNYTNFIHVLQKVGRRGEAEQVRKRAEALGYFDDEE